MKYFLKKLLGHEIFRSIVSWATKNFYINLWNPPAPRPTYLMYAPLDLFPDKLRPNKKAEDILKGNFRKFINMFDAFHKGIMSLFKITMFR